MQLHAKRTFQSTLLLSFLLLLNIASAEVQSPGGPNQVALKVLLVAPQALPPAAAMESTPPIDSSRVAFTNLNFPAAFLWSTVSEEPSHPLLIVLSNLLLYLILISLFLKLIFKNINYNTKIIIMFAFSLLFISVSVYLHDSAVHGLNQKLAAISELLDANGISYDIITSARSLPERKKYSTIIFIGRGTDFTERVYRYYENGESSLIAFYDGLNEKTEALLGVQTKKSPLPLHDVTVDSSAGLTVPPPLNYLSPKRFISYADITQTLNQLPIRKERAGAIQNVLDKLKVLKQVQRIKSFARIRSSELYSISEQWYQPIRVGSDVKVIAFSGKDPIVTEKRTNQGTNYYCAVDPASFLSQGTVLDRVIISLILKNSNHGFIATPLSNSLVLRMDDPGASQNAFSKGYAYRELQGEWEELFSILKREQGKLSVFFCPGWVDDGDFRRGKLFIKGVEVRKRNPGEIFPSKDVVYEDIGGWLPGKKHDYSLCVRELAQGVKENLVNVESHGWTHLSPKRRQWATAIDRYSNWDWYREFYDRINNQPVSFSMQFQTLLQSKEAIREWFGVEPASFVPAGHAVSANTLQAAMEAGFKMMVMENYVFFNRHGFPVLNRKIVSVPPGVAESPHAISGNPSIAYFHALDIAMNGPQWLEAKIQRWKRAGVKRIVGSQELASYLALTMETTRVGDEIQVRVELPSSDSYFSRNPMHLMLKAPEGRAPESYVLLSGKKIPDAVKQSSPGEWDIQLPPFGGDLTKTSRIFLKQKGI